MLVSVNSNNTHYEKNGSFSSPSLPLQKRPSEFLHFQHLPRLISTATAPTGNEANLVGGLNPFEKHYSDWIISPSRGKY